MKAKVRLTHTVEMFVEAESEEAIREWLNVTTPEEAVDLAENYVAQEFDGQIICYVRDNSEVDYVIK